ncbi:MAG: HD domain-containing phosphohydrolase [Gemmatimonadota bacterium]
MIQPLAITVPGTLAPPPAPPTEAQRAIEHLAEARSHERAGRLVDAIRAYDGAIVEAVLANERGVQAEALRRLGVVWHHRGEFERARTFCRRSREVAEELGDNLLAAEAFNTLAGLDFETGAIDAAREGFHRALLLGGADAGLRGRIQQNLGILANIQGDLPAALDHYRSSLEAFERAGNDQGCAIAFHNLGMISADQKLWDDAEGFFRRSHEIAERIGDLHLQGLCRLNHAEVLLARQCFEECRLYAEESLRIFDDLGTRLDKADAYKLLGMLYRETGRPVLAEARFRSAIELAVTTASVLSEAEASRELARLYQDMGRNQDALTLLNGAYRLFGRLDARVDQVDVAAKVNDLEGTYLAVVREWGQSIESADSYTFGHCERVADYACQVGRALGMDEHQLTAIRLGAYLHDVGKMRVPHEILNKAGALTAEEFDIIRKHPVWGLELLASVEFPWDIKPIIRWHHEKYDGTGYPDRLKGDEIPLGAQIICIVDVYDALTTTRSYRAAMSPSDAVARMQETRSWWRPDVLTAFLNCLGLSMAAPTEPVRPAPAQAHQSQSSGIHIVSRETFFQ